MVDWAVHCVKDNDPIVNGRSEIELLTVVDEKMEEDDA